MTKIVDGWELLDSGENDILWDKAYKEYSFTPSMDADKPAFTLKFLHDIYDCGNVGMKAEFDIEWINVIREIFSKVKDEDAYMYVLDWNHSGFRYNPKIDKGEFDVAYTVKDSTFKQYNVYLPKFYPDGEYYLFLDKDLKWGYLTDPWRKHIYVYGEKLRREIRERNEFLGLILVTGGVKSEKKGKKWFNCW